MILDTSFLIDVQRDFGPAIDRAMTIESADRPTRIPLVVVYELFLGVGKGNENRSEPPSRPTTSSAVLTNPGYGVDSKACRVSRRNYRTQVRKRDRPTRRDHRRDCPRIRRTGRHRRRNRLREGPRPGTPRRDVLTIPRPGQPILPSGPPVPRLPEPASARSRASRGARG